MIWVPTLQAGTLESLAAFDCDRPCTLFGGPMVDEK